MHIIHRDQGIMSDSGCATIRVLGKDREDRALVTVGKIPGFDDSTSWPMFEFMSLLKMKAGRLSISVEERASKSEAATAVAADEVQ